jgi:hypothetical protein
MITLALSIVAAFALAVIIDLIVMIVRDSDPLPVPSRSGSAR